MWTTIPSSSCLSFDMDWGWRESEKTPELPSQWRTALVVSVPNLYDKYVGQFSFLIVSLVGGSADVFSAIPGVHRGNVEHDITKVWDCFYSAGVSQRWTIKFPVNLEIRIIDGSYVTLKVGRHSIFQVENILGFNLLKLWTQSQYIEDWLPLFVT